MKDSFLHKGLRKKLVDNLRSKGINNNNILDAIMNIPRHLFMDNAFINFAYQDKAFPIGSGQTISQPYTVAFQTDLSSYIFTNSLSKIDINFIPIFLGCNPN